MNYGYALNVELKKILEERTMLETIIIIVCLAASVAVYPKFVKVFGEME